MKVIGDRKVRLCRVFHGFLPAALVGLTIVKRHNTKDGYLLYSHVILQ